MRKLITTAASALAAPALMAALASPASALTIVLNDVGATPMSAAQLSAFQQAAQDWQDTFSDPITVYIDIAFDDLDDFILGSTRTARTTHPFTTVRSAMASDAQTASENAAVAALPGSALPVTVFNGERNDNSITLSTANAKALGLGTGLDPVYGSFPFGVDAEITFSTDYEDTFDYDPSDGVDFNKTDFVTVARHEIGHALGFFSVTDVQDLNPGFTLRANTLDLWRFVENGTAHNLGSEPRLLTAGDAEYYDSTLNNVPLSHGSTVVDPVCGANGGACQASHWSDDQEHLMDPTIGVGIETHIEPEDRHALNYVGYNEEPLYLICCIYRIPLWDWWWTWWFDDLPFIPDDFPMPQWNEDPPEWANVGWATAMDLGDIGRRTAVGFARFEESLDVSPEIIEPAEGIPGEMNLNPPAEPMFEQPPALFEMTFRSDEEGGVPFRFEAQCGEFGCQYDPTIGEFGGYRIPGFIDAEGDGREDVDARVTLIMAADESVIPNPDEQNQFKLDERSTDNIIVIDDFEAFGLEPPADSDEDGVADSADNCVERSNPSQRDSDNDGIGNACDADIAQPNDCVVNFADLGALKAAFLSTPGVDNWNPDADLDGDDRVNFSDLGVMKQGFLAVPGPSGIENACQ
ncbi:MAG: NF038122 family metalloprotease [Pseudomonadota bacterium]